MLTRSTLILLVLVSASCAILPWNATLMGSISRLVEVIGTLAMNPPRQEPRKINLFVASLPRTGTSSLQVALERLGYNVIHGGEFLDHNQAIDDFYEGRISATRLFEDFGQAGFDVAGMDLTHHLWRWAAANENMPVILTTRADVDKWAESVQTLSQLIDRFDHQPFSLFQRYRRTRRLLEDVLHFNLTGGRPDLHRDAQVLKEGYARHLEGVKASVASSRLLVYNVREGWGPLCSFLNKTVPDEPFPHVNDSSSLKLVLLLIDIGTWAYPLFFITLPFYLYVGWSYARAPKSMQKGKDESSSIPSEGLQQRRVTSAHLEEKERRSLFAVLRQRLFSHALTLRAQ